MLVKRSSHRSVIHLKTKPSDCQYRPLVDEILRAMIGLDFETAAGVQGYMLQLLDTWKGGPQSEMLKANRRKLRRGIVERAQEIWEKTRLNGEEDVMEKAGDPAVRKQATAKKIVVHTRERWAPVSMLPTFLFPARLLTRTNPWLPYDSNVEWLRDPTMGLETSRDVLRVGADWIDRTAEVMLQNLVIYHPDAAVTTWIQAAEKWHIQRLKHDLYSGKYLNLQYGGPRLEKLQDVSTRGNNRLDVVAKKLRIDPLFPVGTLTDHEKRVAVACFNKIIRHRCSGCPLNNLLILPCGLEEIVRHFSIYHPYEFFLDDKWTIRG
jgi:hypothetical protein